MKSFADVTCWNDEILYLLSFMQKASVHFILGRTWNVLELTLSISVWNDHNFSTELIFWNCCFSRVSRPSRLFMWTECGADEACGNSADHSGLPITLADVLVKTGMPTFNRFIIWTTNSVSIQRRPWSNYTKNKLKITLSLFLMSIVD